MPSPFWFAAVGVGVSFLVGYWSFYTAILYGIVGYLLGYVRALAHGQKELRRELELLEDRLHRLAPKPSEKKEHNETSLRPEPESAASRPSTAPLSRGESFAPPPSSSAVPPPATPIHNQVETPKPPVREIPLPQPVRPYYEREKKSSGPSWTAPIIRFFTEGNVIAKVGALLLFVGISFLIKLVAEQGLFPLEFRLLASGVAAFVLFGFGLRLRKRNETYSLILQGTGFGVFYLTVFGSFRIWNMIPAPIAFGLVVGATVLFCLLSVIQSSKTLAALSLVGGFSAPVLISTGSGNHVALFTYYALLNLGILAIAKYRPWRELNLIGFAFTYIVGTAWGAKFYQPAFFWSVEPFLVFHFLLYVTVSLLFSKLKFKLDKDFLVDATLVFGVPIATFALQSRLVKDFDYGMAITAAAFGLFYVGMASVLLKRGKAEIRLMVESYLAAGICFTCLAVPFALNNAWTSAVWAVQGAFLVWVSIRQNRQLGRYFGMALQVLASLSFFTKAFPDQELIPVTNAWFLGSVLVFASCLFIGYQFFKKQDQISTLEKNLVGVFVFGGIFWWLFGVGNEVPRFVLLWNSFLGVETDSSLNPVSSFTVNNIQLMLAGLSFVAFYLVALRLSWTLLSYAVYGLLGIFVLSFSNLEVVVLGHKSARAPFLNSFYIGMVMLALSSFFVSRSFFKGRDKLTKPEQHVHWFFLIAGYFWWLSAHHAELAILIPKVFFGEDSVLTLFRIESVFLIFLCLNCWGFRLAANAMAWPPFEKLRYCLTPIASLIFLVLIAGLNGALFKDWGLVAWPLVILTHYSLLRWAERKESQPFDWFSHLTGFWLFSALFMREGYLFAETHIDSSSIWRWVFLLGLTGAITALPIFAPDKSWPWGINRKAYLKVMIVPHIAVLLLCSQFLNVSNPGDADPLPFIPFVNPLGILVLFSILIIVFAYSKLQKVGEINQSSKGTFWSFIGCLVFAWLTMGLIRTIHHYNGVPWDFDLIVGNRVVQSSLSIFWGFIALFIMIFAHRKGFRPLWIAGTLLMAIVVGKLFLFDLKERNTLERVISFIGSGVLMLVTGYFAPIPPAKKERESDHA